MARTFYKNRHFIYYGAAMALLLFLLRWLELRFVIIRHSYEIYTGAIAVIFTTLGIWIASKLTTPRRETLIIEKAIIQNEFTFNEKEANRRNISKRELEVLTLMASGMSNEEIAASLFVSTNTVKTHAARIFEKLQVKRRTQAVETGKRLGLLP